MANLAYPKGRKSWNCVNPDQFLDKSFKLIHPFDHPACTRDVLSRTLFETLVIGPSALAQKRHATLKFYTDLAKQLAVQEDKLHQAIGKDQQNILSGKNFLLLQRMAKDAKYNDPHLVQDGFEGALLTGMARDCAEFPSFESPPKMSSAEVMRASKWTRHAVASSSRSSGDPSLDKELYQITCEERNKGWLKGPLSLIELAKLLGPLFCCQQEICFAPSGQSETY